MLLKDAKGTRLEAILRVVDSADLAKPLANVVTQKDVIGQALDQLARLAARREAINGIPILIDEIVRLTFGADGSEREWLSAALTRLVGGVALQNENSSQADAVLSQIERANRKLKTAISSSGSTGKVWSASPHQFRLARLCEKIAELFPRLFRFLNVERLLAKQLQSLADF